MNYNDIFCAQKKAENKYNPDSDKLTEDIMDAFKNYVQRYQNFRLTGSKPHLYAGLVVGYVQSGKTQNYCHLMNRAIDNGFQLVVVFSGGKNDLNMQTADRLADDVVGFCNPNVARIISYGSGPKGQDFISFHNSKQDCGIAVSSAVNPNINGTLPYNGKYDFNSRTPKIYWLTACDKGNINKRNVDFYINYQQKQSLSFDDFFQHDSKGCYVIVVKKQTAHIKLLYDFFNSSSVIQSHKIQALLIDDECDEITVSSTQKRGKISGQIGDIQGLFATTPNDKCHSMYVEYTATPVANICVKNRPNTNVGFPDDFIKLMKQPPEYCGFMAYDRFRRDNNKNSMIVESNSAQAREAGCMTAQKASQIVKASDLKKATPVFYKAMLQYIINCHIFRKRFNSNSNDVFTAMLLHTDWTKGVHSEEKKYVENALETLSMEILEEVDDVFTKRSGNYRPASGQWLLDDLKDQLDDIQRKMSTMDQLGWYAEPAFKGCNSSLYPSNQVFDLVFALELLEYMLRRKPEKNYNANIKYNFPSSYSIQILEINSSSVNQLPQDQNFIAIGGNKLSRGLTLHNLSVTYFTRKPNAIDTFTQMSRWFGYRVGYFDICRLYLDDYAPIHTAYQVEKELHRQIRVQNRKQVAPKDMNFIFENTIPMVLSGKQKVRTTIRYSSNTVFELRRFYYTKGKNINTNVLNDFFAELFNKGYMPKTPAVLNVIPGTVLNQNRFCYIPAAPFSIVSRYLFQRLISVSNKQITDETLVMHTYLKAQGCKSINILLSGRAAGKGTSFANGCYRVSGLAVKITVVDRGGSYFEVPIMDDCPEDEVVDYDPKNLNADFTALNGSFKNRRDPGYVSAVRNFGRTNRTKPLLIITPFEVSRQANLPRTASNVYYSVRLLVPQKYSNTILQTI